MLGVIPLVVVFGGNVLLVPVSLQLDLVRLPCDSLLLPSHHLVVFGNDLLFLPPVELVLQVVLVVDSEYSDEFRSAAADYLRQVRVASFKEVPMLADTLLIRVPVESINNHA